MTARALLMLLFLGCRPAAAQAPTNVEIYKDHAVACLLAVPDTARTFALQSPGAMAFLEAALVARWVDEGKVVYRTDSTFALPPLPRLTYHIEAATVTYAAARRKRLARTVSLALQQSWTASTGQILRTARCAKSSDDVIFRRDVEALETPAYPATVGVVPPARWTQRYLEPLALGAATVLTVFLFFNLRSKGASPSGQ